MVAQGGQEDIQKLVNYLRGNPGLSYVVKLDVDMEEPLEGLPNFHVRF